MTFSPCIICYGVARRGQGYILWGLALLEIFVGLRNLFKGAFGHYISSDTIPKHLFLDVTVCFYQAAGKGQLSCSPGLIILSFFVLAFDVVH